MKGLEELNLIKASFHRNDRKGIIKENCMKYRYKVYSHESDPNDSLFQGVLTYKEVEQRIQSIKEVEV